MPHAETSNSGDWRHWQDWPTGCLPARNGGPRRAARFTPVAAPFDWENQSTWAPALAGVSAAYVTFFPDLSFPGAPEKIKALTEAATAAGVDRLVLLSGRGETHAQTCEGIVRNCGLDYTLVRASWFAQNFSEGYLHGPVMEGVVAMPAGDVAEPFVDIDDIAEVVVGALTDTRHSRKEYDVTGPRLLTFQQAAAELGQATGRPVSVSTDQPRSVPRRHDRDRRGDGGRCLHQRLS